MKPFVVTLQRSVVHEASVRIHAEDTVEAERLAKEQGENDMVLWVECLREIEVEAKDD